MSHAAVKTKMTVKDFIKVLQDLPDQDMDVVVSTLSGVDSPIAVTLTEKVLICGENS